MFKLSRGLPLYCIDAKRNLTLREESQLLTGLVYSAKARIFNDVLYVRYIHLTKGQAYS
jgi:hypothetical protein